MDFISHAAMVLHLEAGTCQSGSDSDRVDRVGAESAFSQRNSDNSYYFACPRCQREFRFMSGLLQHGFDSGCDINDFDELEEFLRDLYAMVAMVRWM